MLVVKKRGLLAVGVVVASFSLLLAGCANTETPESDVPAAESPEATDAAVVADCAPLKGQTISFVVPYSPGGAYDTFARLIAAPLAEAVDAKVIVENQPGAGGLVAINGIVHGTPDGTEIAIMNGSGVASSVLGGGEGSDFSLDDLSYIGRVAIEDAILVSATDSDYDTWEDVVNSDGFRFGSTGPGSGDHILQSILMEAFPLKNARIVSGFPGQSESALALLQGNIDGITGPADSRRAGIVSGDTTALLSITMEPNEVAPDAPYVGGLELDDEQNTLLKSHIQLSELGRPLVAPPGMEPATLACLRDAYTTLSRDPEFLEQAAAVNRPVAYLSGADLENKVLPDIRDLPEVYLTALQAAFK